MFVFHCTVCAIVPKLYMMVAVESICLYNLATQVGMLLYNLQLVASLWCCFVIIILFMPAILYNLTSIQTYVNLFLLLDGH